MRRACQVLIVNDQHHVFVYLIQHTWFGGPTSSVWFGSTPGFGGSTPVFGGSTPVFGGSTPEFGGPTPGFGGSTPRVWWINTRFWLTNTRCLVDQHAGA